MKYVYDDGGREEAGFRGKTGDCAVRAVAIVTGRPYREVYDEINALGSTERRSKRKKSVSSARSGVYKDSMRRYMAGQGFQWVPTMGVGTGCKVHLSDGELPMGRLVVQVSKHYVAVIDGVIHDTYDPSDRVGTVYPKNYLGNIPVGSKRLESGDWYYNPARCVYGYWTKKDCS